MKLKYDLPQQVMDEIVKLMHPDEAIHYCVPADMSSSGLFAEGWLIITNERLYHYHDNMMLHYTIQDGEDYKSIAMVGNGCLEATIQGQSKIIARYTMSHAPRYTYIAKALNQLKEKGASVIQSVDDENKCLKCSRLLSEGSKVCPACTNKIAVAKKLWSVAKKQKVIFLIGLLILWTITAVRMITPSLYRNLVDGYLMPQRADVGGVMFYVGAIGLTTLLTTMLTMFRGRIMAVTGSRLSHDLRDMVYQKIQALSISYLDQRKTGDLMNRVTGDTGNICNFIQFHAGVGLNEILVFISVSILLFVRNWQMALCILLPAPLAMVMTRLIWNRVRLLYRAQGREWDKVESLLQDILNGIRVVKAFGQEEHSIGRFNASSHKLAMLSRRNEKAWNTLLPILSFIMRTGSFLILIYGGSLIIGARMQLGELIEFNQYAGMIYGPLQHMSFFPKMLADSLNATERIFEVMDEQPAVMDSQTAVNHTIDGHISFQNVTFGYKSHEPVLEDISIDINKGEMIGLVGHSGAGKSTFINLVMRFYDTDGGCINIDGVDIRNIPQHELRSQIGVVLQETFLFSGTVMDNIRYSKPDASMEEIIRAAKIANAHDFITRFPDAYDTKVGEKGQRLSGGERQRIAIARAILCNPRILILDEATASLDTETEQQIQEALGRLTKNRTTIAIAHRLSTLKNANRLLVIEGGKKAELGTHEELIKSRGVYYKMVMAQREMSRTKGIDG